MRGTLSTQPGSACFVAVRFLVLFMERGIPIVWITVIGLIVVDHGYVVCAQDERSQKSFFMRGTFFVCHNGN
jgi:hypothetical protein